MIKPKHEMSYGQPVWDIYACEICGSLVLPSTAKLHEKFHNEEPSIKINNKPQTIDKECPKCKKVITLPLDQDGAMILDDYDDHMDFHEESEK
jgi:hypothetical protein